MKSFQEILKNMCFSKEIYNELNSKISQNTTTQSEQAELVRKEEFVEIVRKVDNCFNGCYYCGNNLEEYENGFLTSHGFCDECLTTQSEQAKLVRKEEQE